MHSRLIDGLEWDLDEDGSGSLCNVHGDKVHLRQGDMDGACGPYCLVMAMLVRGQLRRRQAKGLERVDSRSRYGRLMKALGQHGPLLRVGTTGVDLLELLAQINDTEHFALKGEGRLLVRRTREYLQGGYPVVLGFHGRKGSDIRHWGPGHRHERARLPAPRPGPRPAARPGLERGDQQRGAWLALRLSLHQRQGHLGGDPQGNGRAALRAAAGFVTARVQARKRDGSATRVVFFRLEGENPCRACLCAPSC
ncbi:Uncharacterised protein [Pseudomonas aeruginosa]|nr:Uncharacterised protein [Pseudomonas aeruginosa]